MNYSKDKLYTDLITISKVNENETLSGEDPLTIVSHSSLTTWFYRRAYGECQETTFKIVQKAVNTGFEYIFTEYSSNNKIWEWVMVMKEEWKN